MNKIYKVIYSKVRQCYVVVSEIAKSHGKGAKLEHTEHTVKENSHTRQLAVVVALAISFGGLFYPIQAEADASTNDYFTAYDKNYFDKDGNRKDSDWGKLPNSSNAVYGSVGAKGTGAIAAGLYAQAGQQTVTIGNRNAGASMGSVYIGEYKGYNDPASRSIPQGLGNNYVTSVGFMSNATKYGTIAIGANASAIGEENTIDFGKKDPSGAFTTSLPENPTIKGASVALGYSATAKAGNIAIGAYSDASKDLSIDTSDAAKSYLTSKTADSYVSVGKSDALRRISNVADGAADSDVATIRQLKTLSDKAGVYNEGWGIKIADEKDDNGNVTKKNVISVDRNLGSNEITTKSKNTFKAAGENSLILGGAGTDNLVFIDGNPRETQFGAYGKDSVLVGGENNKITDAGTYAVISGGSQNIASGEHSFIGGGWWNTASGATSAVLGGQSNTASGNQSTIVGGENHRAIGNESTILGGFQHIAIGDHSTISGGDGAYTFGTYSSVSGGQGNVAIGTASSADGGWLNYSYGDYSQVNGGYSNYTLGNASSSLGGRNGVVQGNVSVGIAGGSTEAGAGYALAAGYQSVVTAAGVHREKSNDSVDSYLEAGNDTGGNEGYKYTDVATALGYQATADAPNTVSFGHDKGDVSGYTVNWDYEFETDAQGNMKFDENGMPLVKSLKPNSITTNHYDTAKYNRLVKAADGIEDHDAVVMEQLKNASGVGSKIKVYQTDENGNIKFDENNNPIEDTSDSDAVKTKREAAQKASEDAWGEAIGTGHVADPKASNAKDNGSGQLVTGGTVYDALQKQKTDLTNSLSVNAGWGINIADEKGKDGKVTKKNVVSLDRNLGTNYTDKKHNGDEKVTVSTGTTGLVLGGYAEDEAGNKNNPEVTYGATGVDAVTVGGKNGLASGKGSVVTGGMDNVASGVNSTVVGGDYNDATGTQSVVLGGRDNTASGESSTVNGGGYNVANGIQSVSLGGYSNYALGTGTTSIGGYGKDYQTGYDSSVNGMYSVGIAGGSTGKDAKNSLAAGNQAVVTTENGTAIGYQATTDEANTIAFGHDAGDVSGYTVTWQQLPNGQTNADGTSNDYTKAPTVKETKYGSAFYNRLVKVADGIEDHDAVNVAQLKKLNGMKANVDATNLTNDNVSAWQTKLGNGTVTANNAGLVTGDTVYKETRVSATDAEGNAKTYNYISADNTAGANLESLDTHIKTNADQIGTNTTDISTNTANITKNAGDITELKNLSNITEDGKNVIKTLSKGSIGMENGSHTTVSKRDVNGVDTYKVDVSVDGEVKEGNSNIVSGGTVYSALQDAQTKMDGDLAGKANVNASNIGSNITVDPIYKTDDNGKKVIDQDATDAAAKKAQTKNANAWGTAIGTGTVAKDNGQLVTGKTVYDALHGGLDDLVIGHAGKDGKDGQDGSIGLVGQTGAKGEDGKNAYATTIIKTEKGADGVDGKNGEDGITRIVYNDTNNPSKQQTVATLDDGMKFKGDDKTVIAKKLNNTLEIIGGADNTKLTDNNIGVNSTTDGKLKIQLAKDLTGMNSTTYTTTTGTGDSATTSTTVVNGNGLTVQSTVKNDDGTTTTVDGPSVTKDGINGGGKQITNIGAGVTTDSNGKYTVTDDNKGNAANIGDVQNIVNDAKKDMTDGANGLNSKANVDASNIGENMKDAKGNKASAAEITKNKEAWASAIGTDTVAKGNKQLVTSDAVATALDSKADKTYVDKQLDTKANKSDVYTKDQTYSKTEVDSKVSNITTGLDGKAGKDLDNISDKGQQVIHNIAKDAVEVVDGTNTTVTKTDGTNTTPTKYAVNVEGKGKVAAGDTGLISGDTLYKEVHIDKDGAYIKGSQSVGQNLSNLDTGLKTTSDLIHTNAKGDTIQIGGNSTATKIDISGKDKDGKSTGRVITGIVSDANDPNSAANVGYVNGITSASNEQIYHDMNMQYNHVENDISRAAAGSNALAALHPMQEFDPDDKAQFALGYGHYRNSNAGAVGAFYQPDENSMVNFGVSFGNGDAGINAGVTFKFGPGGSGHHALTKTQMAKVIDAQSKEIDELKKDNADKDKRIDALEQKMTEILAKLDKSKD
ncbi:ESPR-type extended signal peptide-containing protein [Mitsuokella multacida]|uniref:ESPR-type extended signal peptide-containing protein n=1 Tax=Mitsuokella multacida TaxID=52226 RepID=UPI0022E7CD51|nr:ESPR-type extended signal peptide-containing protein [Mitsuokella multacida]